MNRQFVGAGLHVLAAVVWTATTFATSHGVYSVMVGLHAWFAFHYCRQYHLNRPSVSSRPSFTALDIDPAYSYDPETRTYHAKCAHHGERIPVTLADGTTVAWICKACDGTVYSAEYAMAQDVTELSAPPPPSKRSHGGRPIVIGETGPEMFVPQSYAQHRAKLRTELEAYAWQQRLAARRAAEHATRKRLNRYGPGNPPPEDA